MTLIVVTEFFPLGENSSIEVAYKALQLGTRVATTQMYLKEGNQHGTSTNIAFNTKFYPKFQQCPSGRNLCRKRNTGTLNTP
jgi:hypothetical protein